MSRERFGPKAVAVQTSRLKDSCWENKRGKYYFLVTSALDFIDLVLG